jgi:hypothetical protein
MKPQTIEEKVEWYAMLHKQNLNGRETEDELFEAGILVGIEETLEEKDEFSIEFAEWCVAKNMGVAKFTLFDGELELFKKQKGL